MKDIDLKNELARYRLDDLLALLSQVEHYQGSLFAIPKKEKLNRLHDLSVRRSVTSSNTIEAISVTPKRENELFDKGADPKNFEDYMLLGYNKALQMVFDSFSYQTIDEAFIKDLHYDMYAGYNPSFGGRYKDKNNVILSVSKAGSEVVFTPPSWEDAPGLVGNLVYQFNQLWSDPSVNRLLLICLFVLDFVCIHPFNDGNGRTSRLLTTFLLLKAGYSLEHYYSLSYVVLENIDGYYSSLKLSDKGWKENDFDPTPFAHYLLFCLSEGYRRLLKMIEINEQKLSAKEKVLLAINQAEKPISKEGLKEILYSLKRGTIEACLTQIMKEGLVQRLGINKNTRYFRK